MMNETLNHRHRSIALFAALLGAAFLGGCQSPMYSGTPDDTGSVTAPVSGETYDPPAKVGRSAEEPEASSDDDRQYEYRGGRDPITGRAQTQM